MNIPIDKNKPLLIHGTPGSGKTHLALELTKDMVLTKIDNSMLKSIKNKDYILNIVKKRNITLMFNEVNEKRCLFIDDIHIFQKHDKFFFKMIIDFIKECKYYQTFIVMTCNNSFLKNKELLRIKKYINTYEIKYTYSQYYKKCLELCEKETIDLSLDELDLYVYSSNYNLNNFKSNTNNKIKHNKINDKDNYDSIEKVTKDLIHTKNTMKELFRICENDEIIISYNILENIDKIIRYDIRKYIKIYESFVYSDIIEYNLIKNDKDCIKYMSILSISLMNHYKNMIHENIIMNRYISKCMVLTNIHEIENLDFKIYLYDSYILNKDEKYKNELFKLNKKEYDRIRKIYDIFYSGV